MVSIQRPGLKFPKKSLLNDNCKVVSTSPSRLEAHADFFKIFYEGEIDDDDKSFLFQKHKHTESPALPIFGRVGQFYYSVYV